MRTTLKCLSIVFAFYALPSKAWWLGEIDSKNIATANVSTANNEALKKRFSQQHQQLIPVVAVADMFFSCNQARSTDQVDYPFSFLIKQMDRNTLAEKLGTCLGEDTMQSDVALNFGLFGCFQQQLSHLPKAESDKKMQLVKQAVSSLSYDERQKSFTQCVTEQSIQYLE